jgi:hypothetical protein
MELDSLTIITVFLGIIAALLTILSSNTILEFIKNFDRWRIKFIKTKKGKIILALVLIIIIPIIVNSVVFISAINDKNTLELDSEYIGSTNLTDLFRISAHVYSGERIMNVMIFSFEPYNNSIISGPILVDQTGNAIIPIPDNLNKNFTIKAFYNNVSIYQEYKNGIPSNPIHFGFLEIIKSMTIWIIMSLLISLVAAFLLTRPSN